MSIRKRALSLLLVLVMLLGVLSYNCKSFWQDFIKSFFLQCSVFFKIRRILSVF